jgi:multiple antibiotic resistance protein
VEKSVNERLLMFWTDLSQLVGAILLMVGALLPVVNPLGDAPIFLAMAPGCDELTRADLARRIAIYAFFLLLGAMLLGSFVLLMFGLSIPVVQVAGGAVVCALGWKLLADNPKPAGVVLDALHANAAALGQAFAPLTMPLTIDAGVISVAITVGANHAHTFQHAMIQVLAAVIGAGIIALSILLAYHYAQRGGRRIGHTVGMASRFCWQQSGFRRTDPRLGFCLAALRQLYHHFADVVARE